jgi:uroporphyrinogen decarboxylase
MEELDRAQFWKDDEIAHRENCFADEAPQAALGIRMSDECVFAELGVEGHPWGYTDPDLMQDYRKRYNDKSEKIVGQRLLREDDYKALPHWPYIKRIGEIFEGRYEMHNDTEWLAGDLSAEKEPDVAKLSALLDRVEKLDMEDFLFGSGSSGDFMQALKRESERTGVAPSPYNLNDGRWVRGPVTLATSIFGVENFLMLYYDEPELFIRFSEVIKSAILRRAQAIDKLCGYEVDKVSVSGSKQLHGFGFADDNCCLVTPEMYEAFGFPILNAVFSYYSPDPGDRRYQHSDSAMGHLLPILGRLNFTGVNFGPTVLVDQIRRYLPQACIDGCLAPFTFMRNEHDNIIKEVKRDCQMARESGVKGLNITTAGSINNGSSLESMRLVMQTIQNYGRY